jgi:hypothetical protein
MQKITSTADLKNAIQFLEGKQAANRNQLKEQFHATIENFRPVNLLKNTLHDISSSPNLIDDILGTVFGLVTGLISNLVLKGIGSARFRKLLSPVLQSGVTNFVGQHAASIRSIGEIMLLHIFRKKALKPRSRGK